MTVSRRLVPEWAGRALAIAALIGFSVWVAAWVVLAVNPRPFDAYYGMDVDLYLDAARRWLAGGGFYNDYQLVGPYPLSFGDILYPPPSLVLFVPFTVLPRVLWWVIPAVAVSLAIAILRPAPWALLAIVICLWWPSTVLGIVFGNPSLWVAMFLAIGSLVPFFSPFALMKMTLAPAALLGARQRSWWAGLGCVGLIALLFLPMWHDYVVVLSNLRVDAAWAYSLRDVPLVAIPWLAWLGRRRE